MKKVVAGTFGLMLILFISLNVAFASHGADENDRDCGYFEDQEAAQAHWDDHGYSAENDPERLDRDGDALPCEDGEGEDDGAVAPEPDDEDKEEAEANGEATEADEGGALPNTATNNPLMAAVGLAMAGIGTLFLTRKRRLE